MGCWPVVRQGRIICTWILLTVNPFNTERENVTRQTFIAPEPAYTLVQRQDEDAQVYAAVNTPLAKLQKEQRQLFGWQFSLIMNLDTEDDNGMTLETEEKEIEPFCLKLDSDLRADGNALPLARITWKKTRELLFRVYDPVIADNIVKAIIDSEDHPRPFSYSIDPDEKWEMAEDYLNQFV